MREAGQVAGVHHCAVVRFVPHAGLGRPEGIAIHFRDPALVAGLCCVRITRVLPCLYHTTRHKPAQQHPCTPV